MPKYLVEMVLIVEAKNRSEAKKVADYILDIEITDKEIENSIESFRYEEIVKVDKNVVTEPHSEFL